LIGNTKVGQAVKETEAQLALYRFAHALAPLDAVNALYGLKVGAEMHAWVVMQSLTRADRHAVFAAQVETDPDCLLVLHLTDQRETVPADAEPIDLKLAI
jgi:hypothetical protein